MEYTKLQLSLRMIPYAVAQFGLNAEEAQALVEMVESRIEHSVYDSGSTSLDRAFYDLRSEYERFIYGNIVVYIQAHQLEDELVEQLLVLCWDTHHMTEEEVVAKHLPATSQRVIKAFNEYMWDVGKVYRRRGYNIG